jgi:hypothetical protein
MRHTAGKSGKEGVGETVFAQILWLRTVPACLGQPPSGWNGLGNAFLAPIHVFFRVPTRLTAPVHGKDDGPDSLCNAV